MDSEGDYGDCFAQRAYAEALWPGMPGSVPHPAYKDIRYVQGKGPLDPQGRWVSMDRMERIHFTVEDRWRQIVHLSGGPVIECRRMDTLFGNIGGVPCSFRRGGEFWGYGVYLVGVAGIDGWCGRFLNWGREWPVWREVRRLIQGRWVLPNDGTPVAADAPTATFEIRHPLGSGEIVRRIS